MASHKIRTTPGRLAQRIRCAVYVSTMPLLATPFVNAEEQFNTSFIHGADNASLVQSLSNSDDILPGHYPFDIYLNKIRVDHRDVEFKKDGPNSPGYFCLDADSFRQYGVLVPETAGSSACYDLVKGIPGSSVSWNAALQELDISVPQTELEPRPQGMISPLVYDDGINAAYSNYAYSGSHSRYTSNGAKRDSDYSFLTLNNGINIGAWRFRNNSTFSKESGRNAQWNSVSSWAETDIVPWRSRVLIGQSNTNNNVFDSFQFRGAQLSSVPEMLPDSRRGYAPVVRGVANSNARVEVRQNGYTVYSTVVPPGPFALSDIHPSTLSGDLAVTVIEADGTRHNFTLPYSSVPNMLREGIWEYQVTAGKYHDGTTDYEPNFIQGTISHGAGWDITPYGGMIVAENYRSGVLGIGKNMGEYGAASVDASWSDTDLASGDSKRGASVRFLYSKSLNALGTELQIAGYRYSTSGFYDFSDAVTERSNWKNGFYQTEYYDQEGDNSGAPSWATQSQRRRYYESMRYNNKRQRVELTVNQHVAGASLYATFTRQNYWNTSSYDRTIQTGINTSFHSVNYSLFYQSSRSNYGYSDNSVNVSVSIPFNIFSQDNQTVASFNASHSKQSGDGYSAGLSGTLLDDHRMNYFVQSGHSQYGGDTSVANLGYMGSMGNVALGYNYNNNYQQTSLNVSGGVVAHSGGVTLSQPLQNTFVLVKAPGAQGVRLENQPGVAIDRFGYAVLTSAMPYRHNRVALRTSDIGNGMEIPLAAKDIVPTQRAIGRVEFETHLGHSLLIHAKLADGSAPMIGANIFNQQGVNVGVVGTRGEAYVAGIESGERLRVKWGDDDSASCTMPIPELPPVDRDQPGGYQVVSLTCNRN
ncbi:P pilus assembly protein, porin PapC [Enterobacteriaceae bacterium strain FGI 57]|nr:P pilus assembly protein, porin PapC [Enterobacteriaceae bacterium strain FGI 57]